jgi:hypothetical protein
VRFVASPSLVRVGVNQRREDTMSPTTQNRVLGICSALALLLAGAAGADTFNVDRFDDSTASQCSDYVGNDCSLRGAIIRANSNPGDDLVWLHTGTYTLSIPGANEDGGQTGDLDVIDTVRVVGRGPERTIVDAGGDDGVNDRVFDVHAPGERLTLRGLTVTGGSPDFHPGGGIRALEGSLRLETCAVTGNETLDAGTAIFSESDAPGDLTEIVDSWITANTGQYAILETGAAHIERTTVSGNTLAYFATVAIRGAGSLLLDSTFGGNTAPTGTPVVSILGTAVAIEGCTLLGPDAVLSTGSMGSATLANTLIAGWCLVSTGGQLTTLGGNLESPGDTCGLGGSDLVNVPDPGLSALGFFGGPTPVYQLLPGSPAVDQLIAAPGCPALDQRGLSRPRDGDGNASAVCDIGAVELAGPGEVFVETFDCGFTTPWSDVVR